jgi:hypothetical protein
MSGVSRCCIILANLESRWSLDIEPVLSCERVCLLLQSLLAVTKISVLLRWRVRMDGFTLSTAAYSCCNDISDCIKRHCIAEYSPYGHVGLSVMGL